MITNTVFSFFWKIITFKKGSSLILSSIISSVFMLTANPIFDTLLKNTEFKNIVVPIVVQISGFTVFFFVCYSWFCDGNIICDLRSKEKGKKELFWNRKTLSDNLQNAWRSSFNNACRPSCVVNGNHKFVIRL